MVSKRKVLTLFGISEYLGNISVVIANMFLPQIIIYLKGWRIASFILAIIGIIVVFGIIFLVKSRPENTPEEKTNISHKPNSYILFKKLLTIKQYWIAVAFAGLFLGTLFSNSF